MESDKIEIFSSIIKDIDVLLKNVDIHTKLEAPCCIDKFKLCNLDEGDRLSRPGDIKDEAFINRRPELPYEGDVLLTGAIIPNQRKKEKKISFEMVESDEVLKAALDKPEKTFQETLFYHIITKNLDEVQVYNDSGIDRKLFSKMRSNKDYKPKRKTAFSLCIGLHLTIDEATDLIGKAGYTFSESDRTDIITKYFITKGYYDILLLNDTLYYYGLEPLCY